MSSHNKPYISCIIVDRQIIELIEQSVSDDERVIELHINGRSVGQVHFLKWYYPRVAISDSRIALWGGTRLYIATLTDGTVYRVDQEDEIHETYAVGGRWCLVCEISVRIFDLANGVEMACYEHDEILLKSRWSGDDLVVQDLQGRRIIFEALAHSWELRPKYEYTPD